MNSLFRLDAAGWSPVESLVGSGSEAAKRRGPSLIVAVAIIGGVALLTAGAVAAFFVEPSEGAPEGVTVTAAKPQAIEAQTPVRVASLDGTLPVHRVTTQSFKAAEEPLPAAQQQATAQQEDQTDIDELAQQDPRWARTGGQQGTTAVAAVADPVEATAPAADDAGLAPTDQAARDGDDGTDTTETAAIAPDEAQPKRAAKAAAAPAGAQDDAALTPPGVNDQTRTVQITKGVNMRSRPKSGSSVISVVPKGAAVQLAGNCKSWCQIVYKGQRGYVFRDFIGGGRTAKASASNDAKTTWSSADGAQDGPFPAKPKVKPTAGELR